MTRGVRSLQPSLSEPHGQVVQGEMARGRVGSDLALLAPNDERRPRHAEVGPRAESQTKEGTPCHTLGIPHSPQISVPGSEVYGRTLNGQ